MRSIFLSAIALVLVVGFAGCGPKPEVTFTAGELDISVGASGSITRMENRSSGTDYLAAGISAPLLSLRVDGQVLSPREATWNADTETLRLEYAGGRFALVGITEKTTHAALEVQSVSDAPGIALVLWGPYPTTMDDIIGETVGVVQEAGFALGLQALNPRTLGGYPWKENDAMPQLDIFEGDYSDLSEEGKRYVLYRVEAAKPDSFGSTLQAYTRNRAEPRVIPNMGYDEYVAPAFDDGGVVGSKIALFGAPAERALETLGAIELTEGLPHPMLDGVWAKMSPRASQAYVIMPFSEATADQALDVVEQAGMQILYHPDPFASWGQFGLRKDDFPNGIAGLRRIADRAAARGMRIGGHTLSNFIQPHDAYVSPVPDQRLARVGETVLAGSVTAVETEIPVESPEVFRAGEKSTLRTAILGDELIQYASVSETAPWLLQGVTRGAFGTKAAAHGVGAAIALLADHGYRVFLTDPALTVEMAENLAGVFQDAGLRHISFDGLEGNRSTGMGNYGEVLFAQSWFDALDEAAQQDLIITASRTSHYFWHLYTRMNWGEPWYAGFRESQTEYRMKNQPYFRRNFMPAMLGWFSMRPETSVEDIEWMLARSAAYDAGYAFYTSLEALADNGRSGEILTLLNRWERARLGGAFSADQKAMMEGVAREFHLAEPTPGEFALFPISTTRFDFLTRDRQPGEPEAQSFEFENPHPGQVLAFSVRAEEGSLRGLTISIDVSPAVLLGSLAEGEVLQYEGGDFATVYSANWVSKRTVSVSPGALMVAPGSHQIRVSAPQSAVSSKAKVELRLTGDGRAN